MKCHISWRNAAAGALGLLLALFPLLVQAAPAAGEHAHYRLEKMLVLSRHGIRAPFSGPDAVLSRLTPHSWIAWTARPGELTRRGGELEFLMGQYFRQYLEREGLIAENYNPKGDEVHFYANSFQRTIATARSFSSGMLPIANVEVERHFALNEADPVFLPVIPADDAALGEQVMAEFEAAGGYAHIEDGLAEDCTLLADVLDLKDSRAAKEEGLSSFRTDDLSVAFVGRLAISGSFQVTNQASDALVLQYYETDGPDAGAFGHALTEEEWKRIARLKDLGIIALYDVPTLATERARPLLTVMQAELGREGRIFTFLCGHDGNLASVLPALGAEEYDLPGSIEAKTPIGAKLCIEKWRGEDGQAYASLKLVYQTTQQLRSRAPLSPAHPPASVPLRLKGLTANADGMYRYDDLMQRMASVISKNSNKK